MKTPPYLSANDSIGLISVSRKVTSDELTHCRRILTERGYHVVESSVINKAFHQFSGTDVERTIAFQRFLDDTNIKAILFARGGYGASRIVDQLDWTNFVENPKWLIGFSDLTVVLSAAFNHQVESIHGAVGICFSPEYNSRNIDELFNILENKTPTEYISFPNQFNKFGDASGELIGGNLSLLVHQLGTKTDFDADNKILFIEDLDEYLYHLDRMMIQLKRSGKLAKINGLAVGAFTKLKDNETGFGSSIEQIVLDAVKEYDYPVVFDLPIGHGSDNFPVIMGRKTKLRADKTCGRLWQEYKPTN